MEKVLFKEEQRFTQWWLKLIMLGSIMAVVIPFAYGIYSQAVLEVPVGEQPMSTEGLVVTGIFSVVIMVMVYLLVFRSKLKTKISNEALFVCYPPFVQKWKKYTSKEIENYAVRSFKANREFGGYGMKRRGKNGQAFIISGNTGLQLYLANGKKLLIGTQKKQAIEYAMGKLLGERKMHLPKVKSQPKFESPGLTKAKKFLMIIAVEIVLAILIFVLIQVFK